MADKPPKNENGLVPSVPSGGEEEVMGSSKRRPNELNEEDLAALEEFCGAFDFEDVSFDAFCSSNNVLDIKMFLRLSAEECLAGGRKSIEFTRTIKTQTPSGIKIQKEKVCVEVTWEKGACCGDVICIAKVGDRDDQANQGDLYVTIKAS